jgi:hypothetical protein
MPSVAQFGVVIPPVQGGADIVKILTDIDVQATRAADSIDKLTAKSTGIAAAAAPVKTFASAHKDLKDALAASGGAFGSLEDAISRNASGLGLLLRAVGPLGGAAEAMAARVERAALALDVMESHSKAAMTQQDVLTKAYKDGAIALPTLESATNRLTTARTAAGAAETKYLSAMTAATTLEKSGTATATQLATASQLVVSRRQEMVASNQELATSEGLVNAAENATGAAMIGTTGIVIAVITGLVALGAAIKAVTTAWGLFKDSLAAGAELEATESRLTAILGSAGAAREAMEHFEELSARSGGIFPTEQLAHAAETLYNVGNGFQFVTPLVESFVNIAATTGTSVDELTGIFNRLIVSIADGGAQGARAFTQLGSAGINLAQLLTKSLGISIQELDFRMKTHRITVEDLQKAFIDAGHGAGQFAQGLEVAGSGAIGLIGQIRARWHELEETFGLPIDVTLEPFLKDIADWLESQTPKAREFGEVVAHWIDTARAAWNQGKLGDYVEAGFQLAFATAWDKFLEFGKSTIDQIKKYFTDKLSTNVLSPTFDPASTASGQARQLAFTQTYDASRAVGTNPISASVLGLGAAISTLWKQTFDNSDTGKAIKAESADALSHSSFYGDSKKQWDDINNNIIALKPPSVPTFLARQEPVPGPVSGAPTATATALGLSGVEFPAANISQTGVDRFDTAGAQALQAIIKPIPDIVHKWAVEQDNVKNAVVETGSDYEELEKTLGSFGDLQKQVAANFKLPITPLEETRRRMDLITAAANRANDPIALTNALLNDETIHLSDQEREMTRLLGLYNERLKEEKDIELQEKLGVASLGDSAKLGFMKVQDSWGTMQEQVTKGIVNISDALASGIATGLTDILDGTKSVSAGFRDMAVSILKSIEQIIIKMEVEIALQQLMNALGYGGAGSGATTITQTVSILKQSGGAITGGSGTKDDIPIMAMGGEYMLRQSATRSEGIEKLDLLNRGAAHIVPNRRRMAEGGLVTPDRTFYGTSYNEPVPQYGHWSGGRFYDAGTLTPGQIVVPSNYTDTSTGGLDAYYLPGGGGYYVTGGSGFASGAAGGGGLQMMDTGLSSGIPGGGGEGIGGIDIPPADMSPQFTTAPSSEPSGALNPAFPSPAYGTPDWYASNTAAEEAKYASQPGHAREAAIVGGFSPTGAQIIGSGFYSGPTSFSSASSGLYGGLEGGLTTGSVGGFSGAAGSGIGGGGMGPPSVMRYLMEGGYIYPIPSFATGGTMPWTGLAWMHQGEQITPAAAVAPAQASNVSNQINVHVEYGGGGGAKDNTTGTDDKNARAMANAVKIAVLDQIGRQQHFGGNLYKPRNG